MKVEHILIDYISLPEVTTPQTSLVKGDARSLTIAAASVLAKTGRDAILVAMDTEFPGYGLAQNKGYATAAHRAAIASLGPAPNTGIPSPRSGWRKNKNLVWK